MRTIGLAVMCALITSCGKDKPGETTPSPEPATAVEPATTADPDPGPDPAADPKPAALAIDAAKLAGSYTTDGYFQEISIEADGTWGAFLHSRPAENGSWKVDGSTLRLEAAQADTFVFTEIELTADGFAGKDGEGKPVGFKRIKP